jgi:hypothetical protein
VIGEQAGVKFIGMVAMNERTLGSAAGVSNLLFGVYNTGVALLGEKLRIRYRYDSTAFIPEWANAAFNTSRPTTPPTSVTLPLSALSQGTFW